MSDGQDKSDDLIAELAKLMASNAGTEPEAKPAPKLVTLPENRPAAIRIPGMDAPVAPASPAAPAPAAPPVSLRIPGMDQTASAADAPVAPKPAASFDFGTPPATTSFKPEPMSNWQDREVPRPPVSVRPAAPAVEAPEVKAVAPAPVVAPVAPPVAKPAEPLAADSRLAGPDPKPELSPSSDFDFDFGFAAEPPAPIATQPPKPAAAAPQPAAGPSSADPIADLIAADLDAVEDVAPQPAPAPRPMPAPTPVRAMPQPIAAAARPVTPTPFRPPVANAAPQPQERFGVAPSFGSPDRSALAAKAPAPEPAADRDPMDEIESLIGEAVRVELGTSSKSAAPVAVAPIDAPSAPQPSPVVPPLTTGFAPRRAAIADSEPQVQTPEDAILAAAAADSAGVGVAEPIAPPRPSPYKRKAKPERERRASAGMRQYVGMAVAGTLLLAAGFGLYWVLGMGRATTPAEAPVLQADATPVKETPPPAAANTDNQQGSVVFGELDGTDAPDNEQLVPRDDSANTSVADVDQTVGDDAAAVAPGSESELANRKVRTVTVRPDGTIVSGDEAVAGNEALPVDRPNVPDLPGADVQQSELLAAVPTNDPVPADPVAAAINDAPAADNTQVASIPANPANIDTSVVAPIPVARPADRSVLGGGANRPVAVVAPAAPSTPAPAAVASTGGAYVQLSSQPTEADAQASLRATQNRLSGVLGGRGLAIRQVDLGAKGTWYRVVLPVDSFQEATQTCASFKASGTDCVAING